MAAGRGLGCGADLLPREGESLRYVVAPELQARVLVGPYYRVRGSQIGRAKKECSCSSVAVASDHVPIYLEIRVGRMQQRHKAVNQIKPANIAALWDPETRRASAEAVGTAMGDWVSAHPAASLEERAEAYRVIPPAKALEVCGKRERREEGWFAAHW